MKKRYETPSVEVVKFQYRDQVVAQSACINKFERIGPIGANTCSDEQMTEKRN